MSADTPAPWAPLVDALRADSPIAVLEAAERQLKEILTRELAAELDGPRLRALASFQRDLGFLLKYKPYAVKAASSAEASLAFDRAAELYEAALGIVEASDPRRRELQEQLGNALMGAGHGVRAARVFFDALQRFKFAPRPGDVVVIDRLNVVHSVVGCVLAEFATVSTDMVDRLHDQNEGKKIPAEFTRAFSEGKIRGLTWPATSHRVTLGESGWTREEIRLHPIRGGRKATLGDDERFSASLIEVEAGGQTEVVSSPDRAISVHIASGTGRLLLGTADELHASRPAIAGRAGDLFLIAPHAHYAFANDGAAPLVVAEHRIAPAVAFV